MKKLSILILSVIVLSACDDSGKSVLPEDKENKRLSSSLVTNANTIDGVDSATLTNMPTLDFIDTVKDFGKIYEGEQVSYKFRFTNNGKSPLIISGAQASCGCTAADYPQGPLVPGDTASITVNYNSTGRVGVQNKEVSVTTNSNKGIHKVYIKVEVLPKQ